MEGKKKRVKNPLDAEKVFPVRLSGLMKDNKTTQSALAEALGVTRQAVANYCDGSSSPSWEGIVSIAQFFGCSSDYLLGLSDYQSRETEDTTVGELGLLEQAVKNLREFTAGSPNGIDGLNILLSSEDSQMLFRQIGMIARTVEKAREALASSSLLHNRVTGEYFARFMVYKQDYKTGEFTVPAGMFARYEVDNLAYRFHKILDAAVGLDNLSAEENVRNKELIKGVSENGIDTQENHEGRQGLL